MTASAGGSLLDRRRVELVDDALPAIPHHHEAQLLAPAEGIALVERVRVSAERHAQRALAALEADVPDIAGIALRVCPLLPATIEERIKDYRARNVADWVMYRKALASAAEARGWTIYWYDAKSVGEYVLDLRKTHGSPWNADHKLAMAGALAVLQKVRAAR